VILIRFECDYGEGAHPLILERLVETNFEQTPGYGEDVHCARARELIRDMCCRDSADVHFLVGGTQANMTVIASILRPHQGVIAASTGHISIHETGAIEATGHKVIELPPTDGKITSVQVENVHALHWSDTAHEHIVQPGMVYISNPTETGTIYSLSELQSLSEVCRRLGLPLFLDGARLGYALEADGNGLTLPDIAELCDVFYIGGTKIGALFGEAVVITAERLKPDFRYLIKQRGGMLAKGRLLGIQFETLFTDGLYFEISRHAVSMAMLIRDALTAHKIPLYCQSPTNQQFPILTRRQIDVLSLKYAFETWTPLDDDRSAVRFCTSWATREEDVRALVEDIRKL